MITNQITDFLLEADVSDLSRKLYRRALSYFFRWMTDARRDATQTRRADIIAYKAYLLEERKLSTNSVALYLSVLKSYYRYLERNGLTQADPTLGVRIPKTQNKRTKYPVDMEILTGLEKHISRETPEGRRDLAMIFLAFNLGLRNVEISRLTLGDVSFNDKKEVIVRVKGKGNKYFPIVMIIDPYVWGLVCKYFNNDRRPPEGLPQLIENIAGFPLFRGYPLFSSLRERDHMKGAPLTPETISAIISNRMRTYGLPSNYTAHSLRHGTAFYLIEKGVKIHDLKRLMRHRSITTTQRYLTSIEDDLPLKINVPFFSDLN